MFGRVIASGTGIPEALWLPLVGVLVVGLLVGAGGWGASRRRRPQGEEPPPGGASPPATGTPRSPTDPGSFRSNGGHAGPPDFPGYGNLGNTEGDRDD